MPLSNPRFAGVTDLEDCLAGTNRLVVGSSGDPVKRVQEGLIDLNYKLPRFGADGIYGNETSAAVYKFKEDRNIVNAANRIDGIVGTKTMAALDKDCPRKGGGGGGGGGSSVSPDMQKVNAADLRRLAALSRAESELQRVRDLKPTIPEDDRVVKALQRQLFVPLDDDFFDTVDEVLTLIQANRAERSPFQINKEDTSCFAHVDETNQPAKGITFCAGFFAGGTNDNCRQEVVTHEFFHFSVGLQHFYSTTDHDEAMRCPHHLAQAVFDIALGQVSGCKNGICEFD